MDSKVRESETMADDNSSKKKSKFKSFKKFFVKKKRKETLPTLGESILKLSQSASDITVPDSMRMDYDSEDDIGSAAGVLGSRAVSHDSIFIPEMAQEPVRPVRIFSQENVSDHIKALQLKLQANIRTSPYAFPTKRTDDPGTSSEDDGLPRSPPEISHIHKAIKSRFSDPYKHLSSLSLAGTGSEEDEQVSSGHFSRPLSPEETHFTNFTIDRISSPQKTDSSVVSPSTGFDNPPQFSAWLDNSAAKHRVSVRPKNQRTTKSRKPSEVHQEEYSANLNCTEEEDETDLQNEPVSSSTKEHNNQISAETLTTGLCDSSATQLLDFQYRNKEKVETFAEVIIENNSGATLHELTNSEKSSLLPSHSNSGPNIKLDEDTTFPCKLGDNINENKSKVGTSNLDIMEKVSCSTQLGENISNNKVEYPLEKNNMSVRPIFTKEDNKLPVVIEMGVATTKNAFTLSHETLQSNKGHSQIPHTLTKAEPLLCNPEYSIEEKNLYDKENNKVAVKVETPATEIGSLRKFSVSSAWERPRTSSFSLKGNVESETLKNITQPKSRMSISEKLKDEPRPTSLPTVNMGTNRKIESLTDYEDKSEDKEGLSCTQSMVPTTSDASAVADLQTSPEDKNSFFVKLRTTSLSIRCRDGTYPESNRQKRYSSEFKQEKTECLQFSKNELAEVRSPDINVFSSKKEALQCKSSLLEQTTLKPALPKKPVLQNVATDDNNTNKGVLEIVTSQEKKEKSSNSKTEGNNTERKPSVKSMEKNTPSPLAAAEPVKGTESKPQPDWISLARQKQRSLKDELPITTEKPVNQDAEKSSKERTEVHLRQRADKKTNPAATIVPEIHGQESNPELKEQRQRANTISHPVFATQTSLSTEKEEKTQTKQMNQSQTGQPSWMELAKKKSQAWSDMPQIIK
ncbi:CRACD-like protein [Bombina bombina]|uniref:CRACD-like protein n=1 Tax=Bombina bombina TaxID=8345 RepID=UPI00235AF6C0|nr:CRACD-like protein [Bombina bombina]